MTQLLSAQENNSTVAAGIIATSNNTTKASPWFLPSSQATNRPFSNPNQHPSLRATPIANSCVRRSEEERREMHAYRAVQAHTR